MRVRIWIPGSHLSLGYDPFSFTALTKRTGCGGSLLLEDRRDGRTRFQIDFRRRSLSECNPRDYLKSDGEALAAICGAGELTAQDVTANAIVSIYRGAKANAVRRTAVEDDGAWTLTGIGPPGRAENLMQVLQEHAGGLTHGEPAAIEKTTCPVVLRGTLCSGGVRGYSAITDLLVGPAPKDLHLAVVAIEPDPAHQELTRVFQGRQLLCFSRTLHGGAINWGSAAVPSGGNAIVQFPLLDLGPRPPTPDGCITVHGSWPDGAPMIEQLPLNTLRHEVVLKRPVPSEWRAINGSEELSIHRLAVAVINGRLLAAQRGAVDYNDCRDRPIGPESKPEAYPSFGQPIYAPCAGRVIAAQSDRDDQLVGERDDVNPRGNQVCIKRDDGLVVVLAHLRKGSVLVRDGEWVEAGQLIAQVGNSGRSSQPHLHMHVADSADQTADGVVFRYGD